MAELLTNLISFYLVITKFINIQQFMDIQYEIDMTIEFECINNYMECGFDPDQPQYTDERRSDCK